MSANHVVYGVDEYGDHDQLCRSGVERYFRWGYQVSGARPRYVGSVHNREQATALAKGKAEVVNQTLHQVGAPDVVSWWVQEETLTRTVNHGEPTVELFTTATAATR